MAESSKTWKEEFEERKASGDLIPCGGGKYISKEGMSRVFQQANEFLKNNPMSFLGEQEHPASRI